MSMKFAHFLGPEFLSMFIIAIVSATIATVLALLWQRSAVGIGVVFTVFFGFSLTGSVIGFFSGFSRVGVAGDILPASLVFLSAGAAYLYAFEDVRKALVASSAVIAFTISLAVSYYSSSWQRSINDYQRDEIIRQRAEDDSIRASCATFILSAEFVGLESIEQKRFRSYCKYYLSFLH